MVLGALWVWVTCGMSVYHEAVAWVAPLVGYVVVLGFFGGTLAFASSAVRFDIVEVAAYGTRAKDEVSTVVYWFSHGSSSIVAVALYRTPRPARQPLSFARCGRRWPGRTMSERSLTMRPGAMSPSRWPQGRGRMWVPWSWQKPSQVR